jgi:hypothetical protein
MRRAPRRPGRHDLLVVLVALKRVRVARKGGLRQGLTVARATDILFVLLSPELFDALTSGRGWSFAECKRWLVEVLTQQLSPPIEDVSPARAWAGGPGASSG